MPFPAPAANASRQIHQAPPKSEEPILRGLVKFDSDPELKHSINNGVYSRTHDVIIDIAQSLNTLVATPSTSADLDRRHFEQFLKSAQLRDAIAVAQKRACYLGLWDDSCSARVRMDTAENSKTVETFFHPTLEFRAYESESRFVIQGQEKS